MAGHNTEECAFKSVTLRVLGYKVKSLQGFSFKELVDKEYLRGSGSAPIDIQYGDESYEGSITLLKYEYDRIVTAAQASGYKSLLHVPPNAVIITSEFKKTKQSIPRVITMTGVAFTEADQSQSQGDKMTPIDLPFLALSMTEGNL